MELLKEILFVLLVGLFAAVTAGEAIFDKKRNKRNDDDFFNINLN